MTDSLRSTLEAAVASQEKLDASAPAPAPAPAVESPAPAPAPAAEAAPVEKSGETTTVSDNPGGPTSATPPKTEQNPAEKGKESHATENQSSDSGADRAPQSWKPGAKAKWATTDPEIRAEIQRREREVTKVLSDSATSRRFAQSFNEAVAPFVQRLQSANVHPLKAFQSLMHIDATMATADPVTKAKMAAQWLLSYQVDLQALDAALSGNEVDSPDARIERLLSQKLAPVQEFISGQRQREQQIEQQSLADSEASVAAMAADTDKYPDFELVREDMADLIEINSKRGVSLSLEQAYTRAVAMNPDAQAAVASRSKQAQAQKANAAAQRSLGASLSVSGAPSVVKTDVPATDLRGTLEAAVAAQLGR